VTRKTFVLTNSYCNFIVQHDTTSDPWLILSIQGGHNVSV